MSFSPLGPRIKPYPHPTPQPHFGRDALFERNARFEAPIKRNRSEPSLMKSIRRKLNTFIGGERATRSNSANASLASSSRESFSMDNPSKEMSLYNEQGRIRGKAVLQTALTKASNQYASLRKNHAPPKELALAGIQLANAQLAADVENESAFKLLNDSLNTLHNMGFPGKGDTIPPTYIHGLYNRGCYVLNNDLYQYTAKHLGPEEMEYNDAAHEGLAVYMPEDRETRDKFREGLVEGLPYLKEAIELSKHLPDQKLALVEYVSAKGEVMHALSHLNDRNPKARKEYDQEGLSAFRNAFQTLSTLTPEQYSSRHLKLAERLHKTKIPHMCSHQHQPEGAQTLCAQLDTQGGSLITQFQKAGITPPSETRMESLARLQAEHADNPYDLMVKMLLFPEQLEPSFSLGAQTPTAGEGGKLPTHH